MARDTRTVLCRITRADVATQLDLSIGLEVLLETVFIGTDGSFTQPQILCVLDPTAAPATFGATMRTAVDNWAANHGWNTPVNNLFIPAFNKV